MTSYLGSWHSNISFLELFGRNTKREDSAKGCTPQLHHTHASHTHIPPPPPTHRQTRTPWPIKKSFPDQEALLYGTWAGTPKGAAHTHWVGETARASTRGPVGTVLPDPVFPPEASGCLSGARINEAKKLVFLQPGVTQTGQGCSLSLIQGADANQLA